MGEIFSKTVHCSTFLFSGESSSSDIIGNAIRSFEWNGILVKDEVDKKLWQLSDDFNDTDSLKHLVSRISQYLL